MAISLTDARDGRVARAEELVQAGAYLVTAGAVLVYSDCPDVVGGGYTVEGGRCPCPDATVGWAHAHGLPCKHQLAAEMVLAARRDAAAATLESIEAMFAR